MKIGEYCNRDVVTISPKEPLRAAAELMRKHHVGDVVVVDRDGGYLAPLGILTDRDIVVEVLAEGVGLDDVAVGDAMTREPVTAYESEELLTALERMRENAVRRLLVVNEKDELAGIVTVDDFIGLVAKELAEIWALVIREQEHETKLRA